MAGSGGEGEFRVTDRRRRVEEVESPSAPPRVEEPEPPPAPPRAAGRESAPAEAAQPPHAREEAPPRPDEQPVATPSEPAQSGARDTRRAAGRERSLEGLFIMLASSAVAALGQAPDPLTGQVREKDPAAAAEAIDLLALLREKTDGHRTPRETRLLDGLIYDLQMRYVEATRSGL